MSLLHLLDDGRHVVILGDHAARLDPPALVVPLVHALDAHEPHGKPFPVLSRLVVVEEQVFVIEELLAAKAWLAELA